LLRPSSQTVGEPGTSVPGGTFLCALVSSDNEVKSPGRLAYNGAIEASIGSLKTRTQMTNSRYGNSGAWTSSDLVADRDLATEVRGRVARSHQSRWPLVRRPPRGSVTRSPARSVRRKGSSAPKFASPQRRFWTMTRKPRSIVELRRLQRLSRGAGPARLGCGRAACSRSGHRGSCDEGQWRRT
jgi:hypothetical protein